MSINWQTAEHFAIPQAIKEWLCYRPSMTARLRAHAQAEFTVQLLCHDWREASPEEAEYLHLQADRSVIGREVVLCCDQEPWMYASSVLPKSLIDATGSSLLLLGDRPIGELLFADPGITRSAFQFQQLESGALEYDRAIAFSPSCEPSLWARRSKFRFPENIEMAITEVFFPRCWRHTS